MSHGIFEAQTTSWEIWLSSKPTIIISGLLQNDQGWDQSPIKWSPPREPPRPTTSQLRPVRDSRSLHGFKDPPTHTPQWTHRKAYVVSGCQFGKLNWNRYTVLKSFWWSSTSKWLNHLHEMSVLNCKGLKWLNEVTLSFSLCDWWGWWRLMNI
jgi:hypothetical protein